MAAVAVRPFGVAPASRSRMPSHVAWIVAAALIVAAATWLPLGFVAWAAVTTGWERAAALLFRPRVGELLANTALLLLLTLPACTLLAVALAWLTERSHLPACRAFAVLAAAPLAVPAFVQGYAWLSLFPGFHGLGAAVLVSVLAYFPFVYLPVAATLRRLDPALEDVARSLAQPPHRVFMRVVLPQLRLAITGGGLLVALHLLAEYGLYAMVRFDTFTTAIFDQFQSTFAGPAASMLSGVLVLCCLLVLMGEAGLRGPARHARIGPGSPRSAPRVTLRGAALWAGLAVPVLVVLLSLGVPVLTLARWSFAGQAAFTSPELVQALLQTLGLGVVGAAVATLAAIPVAWLSVRVRGPLARLLEESNYVTGALPGIVVALALVTVVVHMARPLYQTFFTLLIAYVLLFLPRALISLRAGIAHAPPELEQVAQSLGRTPRQALRQVTLRLAAPSAAAGAALVFLGIANELTATLLLAPSGVRTLATGFWALSSEIDYAGAAPYAVLMIVLSLPVTWLLQQQSMRAARR